MHATKIVFILSFLLFVRCSSDLLCGETGPGEKARLDSLNSRYNSRILFSRVPCYPGYIRGDVLSAGNDSLFDALESALMKQLNLDLLLYDEEKKLIRGTHGSM